jgi:hypothetical protein
VREGSPPSERNSASDDAAPAPRSTIPEYSDSESVPTGAAREAGTSDGAPDAPDVAFPWPPAEDASVAAAFVQTWQAATFQPAALFRALPERASLASALLYYLPLGIIIAGAELFWRIVRARGTEQDSTMWSLGAGDAAVHPLIFFLLSPLLLVFSLFLPAAITHALLKLFGGASRAYTTTTTVFAFAYSPMFFSVVPVAGSIIGFIWMVVVAIIGLREAQHTSTGRAAAAVLIPVVFALLMVGLAYFVQLAGTLLETPL